MAPPDKTYLKLWIEEVLEENERLRKEARALQRRCDSKIDPKAHAMAVRLMWVFFFTMMALLGHDVIRYLGVIP